MPLPPGYTLTQKGQQLLTNPNKALGLPSREEIERDKTDFRTSEEVFQEWDWQNEQQLGPQGEALPKYATGWRPNGEADFGTGLTGWWNKAKSKVESAYDRGYEEGLKIFGPSEWLIKKAQGEEKGGETIAKIKEARKPDSPTEARFYAGAEAAKEVLSQGLWGALDALAVPAQAAERVIGTAGYTLADVIDPDREVNPETFRENFEASRMAYAGIFNSSLYDEVNRRVDAGMRPDLAGEEVLMENPWAMWPELGGQMLLDPLNLVSVWGKGAKAAQYAKRANRLLNEVDNPAILKVLDAAGKMDEAAAYKYMDELVRTQQGLDIAASHADDIARTSKELVTQSEAYKLGSLTSDAKLANVTNEIGEVTLHVMNTAGPEEGLQYLDALAKSTSKDPRVAADAISTLMHFDNPRIFFSKAGNKTAVVLGRIMEKHGDNWIKDIQKLQDKPAELSRMLLSRLDNVIEEMFPSTTKMLEAEAKVKAGLEVTDQVRALADRAGKLPNYVRATTRWHNRAQSVIAPINKTMAGLYMGWNPGYALRNFQSDMVTGIVDYGLKHAFTNANEAFDTAMRFGHSGLGAHGFGSELASLFPKKAAQVEKGLSLTRGPSQKLAETFELRSAKKIVGRTYMKTFEGGIKKLVKSLAPDLRAAGFSDAVIKKLPTYIMDNEGDVNRVIAALRKDIGAGTIDLFNDITRIDPAQKAFLEGVDKWDEYAETVLKAPDRASAEAAAKKIFDDLAQTSQEVYGEGRAAASVDDQFSKMAEASGSTPQRGRLIAIRREMSRNAIKAAEDILNEADDLGAKLGLDVGSMKRARKINEIQGWGVDAAKEADRLNELAWKLSNESKGGNVNELWMGYPEFFPGTPPRGMDGKVFRDALWKQYDNLTSATWARARDGAIDNVSAYLDDLKAADVPVPENWKQLLQKAKEGAAEFDNTMVGRFNEIIPAKPPELYGTNSTKIATLANRYGIASTTKAVDETGQVVEAGASLDKKLLTTINKYAQTDYKSLEDVPLDVAEEAFKAKAKPAAEAVQTTLEQAPKADLTQEAVKVPRSELPPEVSTEFERVAKELKRELFEGEAGYRQFNKAEFGGAPEVTGVSSTNENWYREFYAQGLRKPALDKALDKIIQDQGVDKGINVERMKELIINRIKTGDPDKGIPPNLKALEALGADEKTLAAALDDYNDITRQEKTLEEILGRTEGFEVPRDPDAAYFDDAGNLVEPARERLLPPMQDEYVPDGDYSGPGLGRVIHEQLPEVANIRKWVMDDIAANFGKKQLVDGGNAKALSLAERELKEKLAQVKLVSSRVAQANRDFTLLNYGNKTYADLALAYLYPFHFWYGRTYRNWMTRIATSPNVLGAYARYKDTLATVHAGMPDWWKYQLNTNDLPGVEVDNPLYFNLESTLWPLNGLTNIDFNDPERRVSGWTNLLDFANKFGPSTWSPLNMATGLALYRQGEKEAGEKWMGRLFPQSNVIKAGASLLGIANLETDPFVGLLQGGLDPYERRRVGRALGAMEAEAIRGELPYTREQIQDAAYSQEGEIWEEAVRRAVRDRSGSTLASFLFGTGYKGRSEQDMEIDRFYGDYNKLWTMRPNLTQEEFREGMDALHQKYPFMDTVLLSRRTGTERDAGLAYNVLTRIPPGQTTEIAEAVGVSPDLLDKFFSDKGAIDKWNAADRQRFMAGVMDIAAILEIPPDMTRTEWTKAKNAYNGMTAEAQEQFGDDILDMVDGYYAAKNKSRDLGNAYLDRHPEVSDYMDWKASRIMNSPLLSAYYGGASQIEGYYRSQMYNDIETKMGKEIFDIIEQYNDLKTYGETRESKAFYRANKAKIRKYYQIKDAWAVTIDQQTAKLSAHLPEGLGASIREDYDFTSTGGNNLAGSLQGEDEMSYQDFAAVVPPSLMAMVSDYMTQGRRITESGNRQLERLANELGYPDAQSLVQDIGRSMFEMQPDYAEMQ